MCKTVLPAFLCVALMGCGREDPPRQERPQQATMPADADQGPRKIAKVREAAVAGLFYPRGADALSKQLDGLLGGVRGGSSKGLRALICPHAGYRYSGKTAAIAYTQALGGDFRTVVVLAPSHYAAFEGASVPPVDAYRTPLGLVPLSRKANRLATVRPFVSAPRCRVVRPGWSSQSPKKAPSSGDDTPHTWEHSLEVQLPFLQKVLKEFTLVPVVCGRVDTKAAAKALAPFVDDTTLIVASSDLSHYRSYEDARLIDRATIAAILRMDGGVLGGRSACGYLPIRTVLHLAKARGWKPRLLDYRNSWDTSGRKSSVVGYAAVGFYDAGAEAPATSQPLPGPATQPARGPSASRPVLRPATRPAVTSPRERRVLLDLARKALVQVVRTGARPNVDAASMPKALGASGVGCFVTLKKGGKLRGCIGNYGSKEPLYRNIIEMTRMAAMRDTRFKPVSNAELAKIEIEISVLTEPRPLTFDSPEDLLAKLRPGVDGVILRAGSRRSTYLPQVWKQIPDKTAFLSHLARKTKLPPSAWRRPGIAILTYQVEAFHERDGNDR